MRRAREGGTMFFTAHARLGAITRTCDRAAFPTMLSTSTGNSSTLRFVGSRFYEDKPVLLLTIGMVVAIACDPERRSRFVEALIVRRCPCMSERSMSSTKGLPAQQQGVRAKQRFGRDAEQPLLATQSSLPGSREEGSVGGEENGLLGCPTRRLRGSSRSGGTASPAPSGRPEDHIWDCR
jgi:hypothetical protein